MVRIGPKDHFWCYMGVDTETNEEYSHCDRCGKYRKQTKEKGNMFISKKQYRARVDAGKVAIR